MGPGALDLLERDLGAGPEGGLVVIVSDSNVAPLYGEPLRRACADRGCRVELLRFPAGEASKTRETKSELEDRLAGLGADRDTVVVALGGGVTCDLAGFLAATWHRGVSLVHAPTSVLAMADAALGGKTAVDTPAGKNLVGAFHQPRAVYADTGTLSTLPSEEYVAGLAEIVKAAVVGDAALFRWLEDAAESLIARDLGAVQHAVASSVRIKGRVVQRDERDAGRRAILNFGHTVAHALETASELRVRHGHAVAIGMLAEASVAASVTGFPVQQRERLRRLLKALGLPTEWPKEVAAAEAIRIARADKKSRSGIVHCSLPLRIGRMAKGPRVTWAVNERDLLAALQGVGAP